MSGINRRQVIASLGIWGSSSILTGCGTAAHSSDRPDKPPSNEVDQSPQVQRWNYVTLDPGAVAEDAYRIFPEGGCMYAVVGSVIRALSDRVGEPFRSFPIDMMRYGDGGVGGWGSLCGVVNGGAALVGLFQSDKPKQRREELIDQLCLWYERTALPQFKPSRPQWADEAEPSVADSILCHVSVSNWCKASGCEAVSMEKKERCRRLSADGARKIVEILNANASGSSYQGTLTLLPEAKACIGCHGPKELNDTHAKMDCRSCHTFAGPHPSPSSE